MAIINPKFLEKPFDYSFKSVNYSYGSKLKSQRLTEDIFKKVQKIFETLSEIKQQGLRWEQIPSTGLLYSGVQAHQIKLIGGDKSVFIENAFHKHEVDSSSVKNCYPSYLAITKEVRLFGYQWNGTFCVVYIDFDHRVYR